MKPRHGMIREILSVLMILYIALTLVVWVLLAYAWFYPRQSPTVLPIDVQTGEVVEPDTVPIETQIQQRLERWFG